MTAAGCCSKRLFVVLMRVHLSAAVCLLWYAKTGGLATTGFCVKKKEKRKRGKLDFLDHRIKDNHVRIMNVKRKNCEQFKEVGICAANWQT